MRFPSRRAPARPAAGPGRVTLRWLPLVAARGAANRPVLVLRAPPRRPGRAAPPRSGTPGGS